MVGFFTKFKPSFKTQNFKTEFSNIKSIDVPQTKAHSTSWPILDQHLDVGSENDIATLNEEGPKKQKIP
jgi:hypothetical protein